MANPNYIAVEISDSIIVTDKINAIFKVSKNNRFYLSLVFDNNKGAIDIPFDVEADRDTVYSSLLSEMVVTNIDP